MDFDARWRRSRSVSAPSTDRSPTSTCPAGWPTTCRRFTSRLSCSRDTFTDETCEDADELDDRYPPWPATSPATRTAISCGTWVRSAASTAARRPTFLQFAGTETVDAVGALRSRPWLVLSSA